MGNRIVSETSTTRSKQLPSASDGEVRVRLTVKGEAYLDGETVGATPAAAHRADRITAKGRAYLDELDRCRGRRGRMTPALVAGVAYWALMFLWAYLARRFARERERGG